MTSFERYLYVVAIRGVKSEPRRSLSDFERLAGWRDGESWGGDPLVINEGHQRGALHSRVGPYILTWSPDPGDTIVVRLSATFRIADGCLAMGRVAPAAWSPTGERVLVRLNTVLGRSVMLGEDDADGAIGRSAIEDALDAAINENDWRASQCDCEIVVAPDDDAAFGAWLKETNTAIRVVARQVEASQ